MEKDLNRNPADHRSQPNVTRISRARSESEVKTERLVDLEHHLGRERPDPLRHTLHGNGPNLFCLSL